MKLGFSLSPGGLLFPYHIGVLDSLKHQGYLTPSTPIGGSSAGAIASAAHAAELPTNVLLSATIDMANRCRELGGARGRLKMLLEEKLYELIDEESFERVLRKPLTIAYRELFPQNRPIHQTNFRDRDDLIKAICHSSTFPFFSSNWPVAMDTSTRIPRLVVDGFFAVPRDRFGCPDFAQAGIEVDQTILVSVFPPQITRINPSFSVIGPSLEDSNMEDLIRLATEASSAAAYHRMYENGYADAERWCREQGNLLYRTVSPENVELN